MESSTSFNEDPISQLSNEPMLDRDRFKDFEDIMGRSLLIVGVFNSTLLEFHNAVSA
jgi:hypothetical protein